MKEHVLPNPRDFVLNVQFFTLKFRDRKVVCGGVGECFGNFLFERVVPFFEFRKMRFNRHVAASLRLIAYRDGPTP
jgi:hypothetical protein